MKNYFAAKNFQISLYVQLKAGNSVKSIWQFNQYIKPTIVFVGEHITILHLQTKTCLKLVS